MPVRRFAGLYRLLQPRCPGGGQSHAHARTDPSVHQKIWPMRRGLAGLIAQRDLIAVPGFFEIGNGGADVVQNLAPVGRQIGPSAVNAQIPDSGRRLGPPSCDRCEFADGSDPVPCCSRILTKISGTLQW